MRRLLFILISLSFILPASADGNKTIEKALLEYVSDKDARIGIAVIVNGTDTNIHQREAVFSYDERSKIPVGSDCCPMDRC